MDGQTYRQLNGQMFKGLNLRRKKFKKKKIVVKN